MTGLIHFCEGGAEDFFRFSIAGSGVEKVNSFVVSGFDHGGTGVDIVLLFESHAAKTCSGEVDTGFSIGTVEHNLNSRRFLIFSQGRIISGAEGGFKLICGCCEGGQLYRERAKAADIDLLREDAKACRSGPELSFYRAQRRSDVEEKRTYKVAGEFLAIAGLLVLLCSCLSFNIGDWPSRFVYPHNRPSANLCGRVGAFFAYHLLYYIGPGVFVILVSGICIFFAKLIGRSIGQPILRTIGLALLTAAASTSFYCLWPHRVYIFPIGSGGVLGVAATYFLRNQFAVVGSVIVVAGTWAVGSVLLADRPILSVVGWCFAGLRSVGGFVSPAWSAAKRSAKGGEVIGDIWRKLSIRQKRQGVIEAERLRLNRDVGPEANSESIRAGAGQMGVAIPALRSGRESSVASSYEDYRLPPLELLAEPEYCFAAVQGKVVKAKAAALEKLLSEFNINAEVVAAETGPVVTMFELQLAAGVKVSQISALANDMARALGAGAVRVVAPLPGKHTIGIEVPNSEKEKVRMKDLMQLAGDKPARMQIPLFLGKDSSGEALVSDLTTMPHLLIAGTTGSGKSVCINSIITGILLTKRPDEVKMILIDPKMVEMAAFNSVPHLMSPIVTETARAVQILEWATEKMD